CESNVTSSTPKRSPRSAGDDATTYRPHMVPLYLRERAPAGRPCTPLGSAPPVDQPANEPRARPRLVDPGALVVHHTAVQPDALHALEVQVGGAAGRPLRPRDPQTAVESHSPIKSREAAGELGLAGHEVDDHVEASPGLTPQLHARREPAQRVVEPGRR